MKQLNGIGANHTYALLCHPFFITRRLVILKLFYWVDPSKYDACLDRVQKEFGMHREVDEEKTFLMLDDKSRIEHFSGSFDPSTDEKAHIRVVINDESLKDFFDSVFGPPYRVR
ncbi:MAG: hypothetical protein HXY34_00435 [Candidatus Thorarchaeota archaeon]|nr:hypothetical protein [Candidatus Thorarchaeota archaeon]